MKFPTNAKPELAVSTDKYRRSGSLTEVYLDAADKPPVLVSTDGHIMSIIPVQAAKEEQGYVSPAVLKQARKLAKKSDYAEISCNGNLTLSDGSSFPRNTDKTEGFSRFPNWRQILPPNNRPVSFQFAINAQLLATLAESLGVAEVILTFEHPDHSILVAPLLNPGDNRHGIIMPCKIKR